jgi:hypothetical protein
MRQTLRTLFEQPSYADGTKMPWYRSVWLLPLPAVILSVAAIVVLLRGAGAE